MAADESAGSDAASAEPISVLADLVARHRPDSRRLRYLIGLLTEEPLDLAALVERSALPRQTVQAVLSAAAGDLIRDAGQAAIQPDRVQAYRQRFEIGRAHV